MEEKYTLSLDRLEICDLLLACTAIVVDARMEMESADCNQYRKEHVLPGTIEKWQKLHDIVDKQLDDQDKEQDWYKELHQN